MAQMLRNRGVLAYALALSMLVSFVMPAAFAEDKPDAPKAEVAKEEPKAEPKKEEPQAKPKKEQAKKGEPKAELKKEEPKAEPKKEEPKKEEPKEAEKPKPAAPPTHTVKKEPFKIELSLNGVFEAKQIAEIPLRPEVWQQYVVVKAIDHGKRVKKGQVILRFDTTTIDDAIRDVEAGRVLADLEFQAAQEQLAMMEQTIPLDIELAENNKKYFDEDVKRYFEVELPLTRRMADENLKSVENYLAYEMEELKQLEKMYKADDLTEETEEIVLKRQRDTIARLQFNLERAKLARDQTLAIAIPREEVVVKRNEKISDMRIKSARSALPRQLAQQRLSMQKMTRDREKSAEYLKKLKADRAGMVVRAPIDGIVYYGQHARGQWNTVGAFSQMLQEGVAVKPGMVLMSVVKPRPMIIRTTVPEASLSLAKLGIEGKANPVGFSDESLSVNLESVNFVPLAPGQFDATLSVTLYGDAASIMPGMACSVKLTAHENKEAITVPANLVQTDEDDEDVKFVYVLNGEKHRKQPVKVGLTSKNKTEILEGLKEGDKVLLNKP